MFMGALAVQGSVQFRKKKNWPNAEPNFRFRFGHSLNLNLNFAFGSVRFRFEPIFRTEPCHHYVDGTDRGNVRAYSLHDGRVEEFGVVAFVALGAGYHTRYRRNITCFQPVLLRFAMSQDSLFEAKAAKGLTFDAIAKAIGKDEVWTAAAFYGQSKPRPTAFPFLFIVLIHNAAAAIASFQPTNLESQMANHIGVFSLIKLIAPNLNIHALSRGAAGWRSAWYSCSVNPSPVSAELRRGSDSRAELTDIWLEGGAQTPRIMVGAI
ncbi:hypothetical protein C8R47DRAFT_1063086 [Mycena vitilis]|nr:hypothetical protein C8R47DRAFT_1063086 [Mycena vitilis]